MKKIGLTLSMFAIMALVSCKKEETVVTPAPETETEVVVLPPPPPPAPVEEVEKDGTSISVGKDGVEVSTKDGDNKTVIDVKDGKGSIEIKK
ncbi:hypothetical protein FLAN108750_12575 [Flavobacterium antarcticum]|uniref:hypothetical protein n=1 Tax=Flavobacterium antarcticum TaxID=271155 RepID=UPI0003B6B100|nr:hypothetical protein [Flavobacterium antarcticum]